MSKCTIETHSATETLAAGKTIGSHLRAGAVLPLYGNLGTGKTVLARGIARGLGIEEPVTSPSFTVVQEYECPDGRVFYHLDMYRIGEETDALTFGIDDYLCPANGITVLEWAERIASLLPTSDSSAPAPAIISHPIHLEHTGPDTRRIHLPPELASLF